MYVLASKKLHSNISFFHETLVKLKKDYNTGGISNLHLGQVFASCRRRGEALGTECRSKPHTSPNFWAKASSAGGSPY